MTDEKNVTDDTTDTGEATMVVASEVDDTGATVVGVIGDDSGIQAVGTLVTDYDNAAIVAAFADDKAAMDTYAALRDAESAGTIKVEGVLVIKTDSDLNVKIQKMTDHSTKSGLKWGAVGGVVLGVIFPPTIIAGALAGGAVGAGVGKLQQELHKAEVGAALAGTLGPNQSGIIALVSAKDVEPVTKAMPEATKIRSVGVDDKTAKQITEAAAQAS